MTRFVGSLALLAALSMPEGAQAFVVPSSHMAGAMLHPTDPSAMWKKTQESDDIAGAVTADETGVDVRCVCLY